jgi:hypothetical protein
MARRLLTRIADALRLPEDEPVHFHQGAGGLPAACYDTACSSPRLSTH